MVDSREGFPWRHGRARGGAASTRRAAFIGWVRANAPTLTVCCTLVVLGSVLRVQHLGFPAHVTWDEDHFLNNVHNYMVGKPDLNDHPPLGKFLLLAGVGLAGDNPVGWRLIPLVAGFVNIVLAACLAKTLFRSSLSAALAAAFVAGDGFLLAYSRTALLDGMLTSFILGVALTAVRAHRPWHLLLGSLLLGCAVSIKYSAVVMVVPLVAVLLLGRVRWWAGVFLLLVPLVFYAQFAVAHAITGKPWGPWSIYEANVQLVRRHLHENRMSHPRSSRWYTWLFPTRPITLRVDVVREPVVRAMSTLGNPLLWWATSLACVGTLAGALGVAAQGAIRRLRQGTWCLARPLGAYGPGAVVCVLLWCLPIVPWIVSSRDSYVYHYLPSYTFGLVLLAGCLAWLYERRPGLVYVGLLLVALVTVFYAPVWAQLPVTRLGLQQRLFVESWR